MEATKTAVTALLVLLAVACSPSEDNVPLDITSEPTAEMIQPEVPADVVQPEVPSELAASPEDVTEHMVSGQVTRVDDFLGIFSVTSSDDIEWQFRFSDLTEVTGDGGTQGLAGTEGTRAAVYYQEGPESDLAVRIELLDDDTISDGATVR